MTRPSDFDSMDDLASAVADAIGARSPKLVQLQIGAREADVSLDDGATTMTVPLDQIVVADGRLYVSTEGPLEAYFMESEVTVIVNNPQPTLGQLLELVDTLSPGLVNGLMAEESEVASMDDPLGLIAIRAVKRAIAGPGQPKPPDHTPLEG